MSLKLEQKLKGYALANGSAFPGLEVRAAIANTADMGKKICAVKPSIPAIRLMEVFAEYCVADYRFIFRLPKHYSNIHVAPLLCAGLIGYRALSMTEGAKKIGFYGFGASAHLLIQIVNHQGVKSTHLLKKGIFMGRNLQKTGSCLGWGFE